MSSVQHVIYLHGFSSSPNSSKARRFQTELSRLGIPFQCPDLNEPDFESLTTTRMLEQTGAALARVKSGPVALIGSSLGGFVAVHAAAAHGDKIDRLILLAPAFDFGGNRLKRLGDHGIETWRREGRLRVRHHAYDEDRDIGYGLYADAARYDAFALDLSLPMLIFQGKQDDTVDPDMVARWAAPRPSADLRLVDDDHQLSASLDEIWDESSDFLGFRDLDRSFDGRQ